MHYVQIQHRLLACLICFSCIFAMSSFAVAAFNSEIAVNDAAQQFIKAEKVDLALTTFQKGVQQYPKSDWLYVQYGLALYNTNKLDEAEKAFQTALTIKDSPKTQLLIEKVQKRKALLTKKDEGLFTKDNLIKGIIMCIIGVFIRSGWASFTKKSNKIKYQKKFKYALKNKDWDTVTDIMEDDIINKRIPSLRSYMYYLLQHVSADRAEEIIIKYVDHPEHEQSLLLLLQKVVEKNSSTQVTQTTCTTTLKKEQHPLTISDS